MGNPDDYRTVSSPPDHAKRLVKGITPKRMLYGNPYMIFEK